MTGERGSLAGTLVANALLRLAGSASGTLVGLYLVHIRSAGAGTAGALGAVAFAAELLFSIPLGLLADAWNPRWVMVTGALLGTGAVQLFGLTDRGSIFYLSRVLEGISAAAITPPLLAWLAGRTEGDLPARARAMSLFELSLLAGFALGGVAATQLWVRVHAGAFSLVAASYLLAALLLALFAGQASKTVQHGALQGLKLALRDEHVRALAPVWLCVNAVTGLWLGPTLACLPRRLASCTCWTCCCTGCKPWRTDMEAGGHRP